MKKITFIAAMILAGSANAQQVFEKLTYPNGKVFLEYRVTEANIKDQTLFESDLKQKDVFVVPVNRADYIKDLCKSTYIPTSDMWTKIINDDKSATYKLTVEITEKNKKQVEKIVEHSILKSAKKNDFYRELCGKK